MKTACIAVIATGAFAADVQPPRLELNLSDLLPGHKQGENEWNYPSEDYTTGTWYSPYAGGNTPKVRTCEAKSDTGSTCAEPKCRAFDWWDKGGHKDCNVRYYLVNSDNNSMEKPIKFDQLNYNERSEWLIKYDAEDAAGNKAKQASFTMIMDDKVAPHPFIIPYHPVGTGNNYMEAGEGGVRYATLSNMLTAQDNYDDEDSVKSTLELTVTTPDSAQDKADGKVKADHGYTPTTTKYGYGDTVKIDTLKVGVYHLTYKVHDHAGMYGKDAQDNYSVRKADIVVRDTVKPVITVTGSDEVHECATPYDDKGAICRDDRDSYQSDHVLNDSLKATTSGTVNVDGTGANELTYSCVDSETNEAEKKTRSVEVVDTTQPTLRITTVHNDIVDRYCGVHNGDDAAHKGCGLHNGLTAEERAEQASYDEHWVIQHTAGYSDDMQFIERLVEDGDGYHCEDTCGTVEADGTLTPPSTTVVTSWHKNTCSGEDTEFDSFKPGVYVLKYECTDAHAQKTTKCRTVRNEDKFKPKITILGRDVMTLEATTTGNYVDDGATCSDATDGDIPENVEVSGDVVKLANIGEYLVQYNCRDAAGNQAEPATRKVIVKQSWGAVTIGAIVEVSFPLLCEKKQFALRVGCADAAGVDTAAVTAQVSEFCGSDQHGKWITRVGRRRLAGCSCTPSVADPSKKSILQTCNQNGKVKVDFTIAVPNAVEANRLVAVLQDKSFPDKLLEATNKALERIGALVTDDCLTPIDGPIITEPVGCANSVTCKMNGSPFTEWEASYKYEDPGVVCTDELDGVINSNQIFAKETVNIQQTGVYHVTYEAVNSQGTWNYGFNYDTCAYVRTVKIVDTLKPIIELKYGTDVVHRTEALDISSASGQANLANTVQSSTIWGLMAEESSSTTNSWLLAAAGSAVTGVALLAFSRKQQTVVTVPV